MDEKNNIDIVDDDRMLRELFVVFAEDAGFTTKSYSSAEHYLEYASSANYTPPTLTVVTDIRMPGKSGYELMSDIRKINPEQKFVVITGTPNDGIDTDVRACFYLRKPVSIERIQTIFDKLESCDSNYIKCKSQTPLCKSLNDLSDFNITDWSCPLENIATH